MIGADGQAYGPVDANQIRRWIEENRARGDTLVQAEGTGEWKPLRSFPEFAAFITNAPPPFAPPPGPMQSWPSPYAARASTKIPAGVCGILLGTLGIHKFILGYTGAGLIMLLLTLVTCCVGAIVTYPIGLIEGIIYLTKTDEEFVRTYVDGRREWF
ncbi:MAG TPA: DUF4339 domain-containing protein [Verrucomicrobia bacterium]|nr:DUF4339 domain-containing protein [Verrucomicrobiota bacterium]